MSENKATFSIFATMALSIALSFAGSPETLLLSMVFFGFCCGLIGYVIGINKQKSPYHLYREYGPEKEDVDPLYRSRTPGIPYIEEDDSGDAYWQDSTRN